MISILVESSALKQIYWDGGIDERIVGKPSEKENANETSETCLPI